MKIMNFDSSEFSGISRVFGVTEIEFAQIILMCWFGA